MVSDASDEGATPAAAASSRPRDKSRSSLLPSALHHEQGHLTVGSNDYEASQYLGDASSLHLALGDQPGMEGSTTGFFRPGWLESHIHYGGSAWQQLQNTVELSQQLPDYETAKGLVDVYFMVSLHNTPLTWQEVSWGTAIVDEHHFRSLVLPRAYSASPLPAQSLAVLFFVLALGSLFETSAPLGAART